MIKGGIVAAGLLFVSFTVSSHDVVDDNVCIDPLAVDDASEWYLVNTCSYAVDVALCGLDDVSAALECGGERYYKDVRMVEPNARLALDIALTQDLQLEYAACRDDDDATGFYGIDRRSLSSSRFVTCLIGQQVPVAPQKLVGTSPQGLDVYADAVNANHCIKLVPSSADVFLPSWSVVNGCFYDVRVFMCSRNDLNDIPKCGGPRYYTWGILADANGSTLLTHSVPVTAELDLEIAACRWEFDDQGVMVHGFGGESLNPDGSFTCI